MKQFYVTTTQLRCKARLEDEFMAPLKVLGLSWEEARTLTSDELAERFHKAQRDTATQDREAITSAFTVAFGN